MSIELNPVELAFRRPFTQQVTQKLHLKNPSQDPIAFKVKTTAPKQYCVRPNSGRIEAGHEVQVQVILQAMKEDIPLETKSRDKFLVQSIPIAMDNDTASIADLWHQIEASAKGSIQERKIRVTYLPAQDMEMTPTRHTNGIREMTPNNSLMYGTPTSDGASNRNIDQESSQHSTPVRGSVAPVGPVSVPASRPSDHKHLGNIRSSAFNPAMSSSHDDIRGGGGGNGDVFSTTGSSVVGDGGDQPQRSTRTMDDEKSTGLASSITNAMPTTMEELRQQLFEAKETIARLLNQHGGSGDHYLGGLDGDQLRQRKKNAVLDDMRERIKGGVTASTGLSQQQQQQVFRPSGNGVPVPVVAGLCLLSFLLAYLLF